MARKASKRTDAPTSADASPEARLDAKLKAMFEAVARARLPVGMADVPTPPRTRSDRRN